jgi:long-chain acyl-CoA synthetase
MLLVNRFIDLVRADPQAPAVVDTTGVTSRALLLGCATIISRELTGHGVTPGRTVLTDLPGTDARFFAVDLAILRAAAVPVSVAEHPPAAELDTMVETLDPACIVTATGDGPLAGLARRHRIPHHRVGNLPQRPALNTEPIPESPGAAACVIATSGSTGQPRFVRIDQEPLTEGLQAWRTLWPEPARTAGTVVAHLPMNHIAQRIMGPYLLYLYGTTVHCATPATIARTVIHARPQVLLTVPHTLAGLTRAAGANPALRDALTGVALIVNGAAALPAITTTALATVGVTVASAYGMTETCVPALHHPHADGTGHLGQSVPGVRTRVTDDGELHVHTPYAGRYVTAWPRTRTVGGPGGWIHTGDHATVTPHGIRLHGRLAATFKTERGRTIAPEPLEAYLRTQEGVAGACVTGAGRAHAVAIVSIPAADTWGPERRQQAATDLLTGLVTGRDTGQLPWHDITAVLVSGNDWSTDPTLQTSTGKPRRDAITGRYSAGLAAVYHHHNEPVHA